MVFSSLLFIYAFLPLQLLIYYLVPNKYKNCVLLVFSIIFYGWSGPGYILILAGESLVSYLFALSIDKDYKIRTRKIRLIVSVSILILVLVCFKYLSLLANVINGIFSMISFIRIPVPDIVLPIGISFYTFQLISYVCDVYTCKVHANKSYWKVLLYAGLFHQCIAGPIVRYETIAELIDERSHSIDHVFYGFGRFSIGLAKKAVLANACAKVADKLLPMSMPMLNASAVSGLWIGAVFYMLQIYLDFSAYSDMAIGLGRMTGFRYLENFNYPYIASSVTDFWRRWHMSLSSFFRDYVYIPLGGNRVNVSRHIFNLFIVWFLTGLWHGASVNFIIWGMYYFVFLMIEKYGLKIIKSEPIKENILSKILWRIVTLIIVLIGWVIFRFDSMSELLAAMNTMFGFSNNAIWNLNVRTEVLGNIYLLVVSIICCTPVLKNVYIKMQSTDNKGISFVKNVLEIIVPFVLIVISSMALAGNSYNPFLYFRF